VYGDLLDDLENLITLHRQPQCPRRDSDNDGGDHDYPGPDAETGDARALGKYVMAKCLCFGTGGRPTVIRVARGSWEPDVIWCHRCDRPFTDPADLSR